MVSYEMRIIDWSSDVCSSDPLAVIRRMVRDLDVPIEIVGVPTQRAEDGLALSSRNAYISEEERKDALALHRALGEAALQLEKRTAESGVGKACVRTGRSRWQSHK